MRRYRQSSGVSKTACPSTYGHDAIALKVRPDQEHLVAPVVKPVGFLMAFFDIDFAGDGTGTDRRSGLWRLTIAAGEQSRGYGRFAVDSVAAEIRSRGGTRLTTTWHPGESGPEGFYLALGFVLTGELSGDQRVGELELS